MSKRAVHAIHAACVAAAVLAAPEAARAEPQGNVGLDIGLAGRGYKRELWEETVFHLGLRGDVLFARDAVNDFGVGPYAELFTHAFDELQIGHGVSLLIPVVDTFPLVLSAGSYGRIGDDRYGFEPGFAGAAFFGSRSFNFTAHYVMAFGVLAQGRVGLGDSEETSIVLALHADVAFLSMPIVYAIDAARGGSEETDPVPR